jgi:hypothetical protein
MDHGNKEVVIKRVVELETKEREAKRDALDRVQKRMSYARLGKREDSSRSLTVELKESESGSDGLSSLPAIITREEFEAMKKELKELRVEQELTKLERERLNLAVGNMRLDLNDVKNQARDQAENGMQVEIVEEGYCSDCCCIS